METIDTNNNKSNETHFITVTDIKNMDPCSFSDGKNPVSGVNCKETFKGVSAGADTIKMPDDPLAQLYFASLAAVALYIFYRLMEKSR
jgi:hypothetical protein